MYVPQRNNSLVSKHTFSVQGSKHDLSQYDSRMQVVQADHQDSSSGLRGSITDQQIQQKRTGVGVSGQNNLKGSYSFNSAFASDIDSINNDLKDLFPSEMNTPIKSGKYSGLGSRQTNQQFTQKLQSLDEDENENEQSINYQGYGQNQYIPQGIDLSPLERQQNNKQKSNNNKTYFEYGNQMSQVKEEDSDLNLSEFEGLKMRIIDSEDGDRQDPEFQQNERNSQQMINQQQQPFNYYQDDAGDGSEYFSGRFNQLNSSAKKQSNFGSKEDSQMRYSEQQLQKIKSHQKSRESNNSGSGLVNNRQSNNYNNQSSSQVLYKNNHFNHNQNQDMDMNEKENMILQQYVQTTLEELQLETQEAGYDMQQQHRIFNHGRNPSQMEMRDLIELAHQDSAFLENNPIFDFNYVQEDSVNSHDKKEGNMNRYLEYLEAQKTQFVNDYKLSRQIFRLRTTQRSIKGSSKQIQEHQSSITREQSGILSVIQQKCSLNPILSPLRSRLKHHNSGDDFQIKDKKDEFNELKSRIMKLDQSNYLQSPLLIGQTPPIIRPNVLKESPITNVNMKQTKAFDYQTSNQKDSFSASGIEDSQDKKPLSKAQLLEKRRLQGNGSQNQTRNAPVNSGLPPQYPGTSPRRGSNYFNNTLNEQKLPSIKNQIQEEPSQEQDTQSINQQSVRKSHLSQKSQDLRSSHNLRQMSSDNLLHNRRNSDIEVMVDDYGRPLGALMRKFNEQKKEEEMQRKEALEREKQIQKEKLDQDKRLTEELNSKKLGNTLMLPLRKGNKSPTKQQLLSSRMTASINIDDLKHNLLDIDRLITSLENKPFERIAKLEQEKLRIVQEANKLQSNGGKTGNSVIKVDVKVNHGEISQGDESPTTRRRNRFRALLGKYTDQPMPDENPNKPQEGQKESSKQTTYMKLRELEKLHVRNDDEILDEQTQENNLLRQKLKIVNEYLSKIVETQITKQEQIEEHDKKWNIKVMSEQKLQERAKLFAEKTLDNSIKHEALLRREYGDTMDLCTRVAQTNYIDHLEKKLKDLSEQIQSATVQKNNLSIKQKMFYKIDFSKKEVEYEKKILNLESELERNAEKIKDIIVKREKIQNELTTIQPKVQELQRKRDSIKEVFDSALLKTENMYITHKLPLMQRQAKQKDMYGLIIEKLIKDLKSKKDETEVMKKLYQVKHHQIDTLCIKIFKVIRLLRMENDKKLVSLKDQRIIVNYLEKAFEFEKQVQLENMSQEIKEKFQKQLIQMLFKPRNDNSAIIEESQSGADGSQRDQLDKSGLPNQSINLDLGDITMKTQGFGADLTNKLDFYDQIVFPNQDSEINQMLDKFRNPTFENQALIIAGQHGDRAQQIISLYNMHKFQGQKSHNLIDDREAQDDQQALQQDFIVQQQQLQQQQRQQQQNQQQSLQQQKAMQVHHKKKSLNQNNSITFLSEESKTSFSMKNFMNQIGQQKKLLNTSDTQTTKNHSNTHQVKFKSSEKDFTLTNKNDISSLNGSFMNAVIQNKKSKNQLYTSKTPQNAGGKTIKIPTIHI
eukprot:403348977